MRMLLIFKLCLLHVYSTTSESDGEGTKWYFNKPMFDLHNDIQSYRNGAVTSDIKECSLIGAKILEKGGNAIDAAIATDVCLSVIAVEATGLGGGGKMIIYIAEKKTPYVINFRERASKHVADIPDDADLYRGIYSISIPGSVAGLHLAWKTFGKLPWKQLIEPSIDLAKNGFKMAKHVYYCSENVVHNIIKSPPLANMMLYKNSKKVRKINSTVKNPELAETLTVISEDPAAFYTGSLAKKMVADLREAGSIITEEDYASYHPMWETPLKFTVDEGFEAYTSGFNSGGPIVAFILRMMKELYSDSSKDTRELYTPLFYHRLAEVMKLAQGMKHRILKSINEPFQPSMFTELAAKISDDQTFNPEYYIDIGENEAHWDKGTSHTGVIDAEGNAVAITTSINTQLGSYFMSKQTGILFNNHMADFNLKIQRRFKMPPVPGNDIRPDGEPLSSISPLIVLDKNSEVNLVSGASGGPTILTSVAQVLINHYWFHFDPDKSVKHWRIHHQLKPNCLQYEAYNPLPEPLTEFLREKGHEFDKRLRCRRSCTNAIFIQRDPENSEKQYVAVGDLRKGSGVAGI